MDYKISVTCASGLEKVLKSELNRLEYGELPAENGRIDLTGNAIDIARLNINLRTADRVYINIAEFQAKTFDELFDNVIKIDWSKYFTKDANVLVNGKCVKSTLFAISACQKIVKKAISDNLCKKYKVNRLEENGAIYDLEFHIFKDTCTLLLNTSGTGLHKRGYRDLVGIAPMRETLASGLVLLSDYYYTKPLCDPFCGSGTILIEGAKIGLNIPASLDRNFAFNDWKNFDKNAYQIAREEGLDKRCLDRKIEVYGSDIDKKAIDLAKHHIEQAGLNDYIKVKTCAVKDFFYSTPNGTIVTNPPYGERVYDREDAEKCYKELGEIYKKLDNYSLFLITSDKNFEKCFGKRADRQRKLYNSNKECNFYYYYKQRKEQTK